MTTGTPDHPPLSRRKLLELLGGGGIVAASGVGRVAHVSAQSTPAAITIPDSGAKLPSEDVKVRILAQGPGPRTPFWKALVKAYHDAHPNITIDYEELPRPQLTTTLPLAIQNGNASDIFQLPPQITNAQAVTEGWVAPLDDLIPGFSEWKSAFPEGIFINGITVFDGKTYAFPLTSNKRYATLTLYNRTYLQQAGYDPAATPLTWTTFREAAKKLTAQGKGKYYGLMLAANDPTNLSLFIGNMAAMAGAAGGEMNWKTGTYNYTSDQFLGAIDLLLGIKSDGSIFPGANSLQEAQALAQVPKGVAAMVLNGPWAIPRWQEGSPDFEFGVGSQPVPDSGAPLPLQYGPGGANQYWIYAKSKNQAVAGNMIHFAGSLAGQKAYSLLTDGSIAPVLPQATQTRNLPEQTRKALSLFDEQMRLEPSPNVRNADVEKVQAAMKPVTPSFGETIQGLFSGQLKDPKNAMQELQDRSDKSLDEAIKAAQAKGAKVSRDDWKFPNWDPTKDYTEADYRALK